MSVQLGGSALVAWVLLMWECWYLNQDGIPPGWLWLPLRVITFWMMFFMFNRTWLPVLPSIHANFPRNRQQILLCYNLFGCLIDCLLGYSLNLIESSPFLAVKLGHCTTASGQAFTISSWHGWCLPSTSLHDSPHFNTVGG